MWSLTVVSFVSHSLWGVFWTSASIRSGSRTLLRWSFQRCWWRSSVIRSQRWSRASLTHSSFIRSKPPQHVSAPGREAPEQAGEEPGDPDTTHRFLTHKNTGSLKSERGFGQRQMVSWFQDCFWPFTGHVQRDRDQEVSKKMTVWTMCIFLKCSFFLKAVTACSSLPQRHLCFFYGYKAMHFFGQAIGQIHNTYTNILANMCTPACISTQNSHTQFSKHIHYSWLLWLFCNTVCVFLFYHSLWTGQSRFINWQDDEAFTYNTVGQTFKIFAKETRQFQHASRAMTSEQWLIGIFNSKQRTHTKIAATA